jgi:ketosteroid isomerase-like protein
LVFKRFNWTAINIIQTKKEHLQDRKNCVYVSLNVTGFSFAGTAVFATPKEHLTATSKLMRNWRVLPYRAQLSSGKLKSMQELIENLFAAIDRKDIGQFLSFIAPDATFRFGSAPPVSGHEAIGAAVGGFFDTIAGLSHELKQTISSGSGLVCEGEVTYTRHDASEITLPFVNVFEVADSLVTEYKVYIDIGPLYAQ